jgi:uncharacterized protein YdaU (DUF1376 family)
MQFYVGDFLASTTHLSLEQRGGYVLVMFAMWNAGGSLPDDPTKLARICGVSLKRWQNISPEILEFFDRDGDRLTQKRLAAEHAKQSEIIEQRRAAGKLGNLAKSLKANNTTSANASAKNTLSGRIPEPEPEPKKEGKKQTTELIASEPPMRAMADRNQFEEFFRQSPKQTKPEAAWLEYRRVVQEGQATPETLMAGMMQSAAEHHRSQTEDRYFPSPVQWLRDGRWNDRPVKSESHLTATDGIMSYFEGESISDLMSRSRTASDSNHQFLDLQAIREPE